MGVLPAWEVSGGNENVDVTPAVLGAMAGVVVVVVKLVVAAVAVWGSSGGPEYTLGTLDPMASFAKDPLLGNLTLSYLMLTDLRVSNRFS